MSGWRFLPEGTELLGPDEKVLWQGRPTIQGLARRFFHLRAITGYFVVLAGWNLLSAHYDGMRAADAMVASFWVVIPAIGVAAVIHATAAILSMTTHYMITDRRIIMQIGTALPIALTLPLSKIGSADLRLNSDGTGDITVSFNSEEQIAYLLLWPHVRPWRFKKAEPMLRSVRDAQAVAEILAQALVASSTKPSFTPAIVGVDRPRRVEPGMVAA